MDKSRCPGAFGVALICTACVAVGVCFATPASPKELDEGRVQLSRDAVIGLLAERIRLSPGSALSTEALGNEQRALAQLREEMASIATRVLPSALSACSSEEMERILGGRLLVTERDLAYNRSAIEVWLRGINVRHGFAQRAGRLEPAAEAALRANVSAFFGSVERSMLDSLAPPFPAAEIAGQLDAAAAVCREKIGDTTIYAFKVPVSADELQRLLADFDARLHEGADRAVRRLAGVQATDGSGAPSRDADAVRRQVVRELTSAAFRILAEASSDAQLRSLTAQDFDPAYQEAIDSHWRIQRALLKQRRQQYAEELERAQDERELKELMGIGWGTDPGVPRLTGEQTEAVAPATPYQPEDHDQKLSVARPLPSMIPPTQEQADGEAGACKGAKWWVGGGVLLISLLLVGYWAYTHRVPAISDCC
jgi:hypothetical protein